MDALANPGEGMRPLRLVFDEGLPVFHVQNSDDQGFFRLVALGMRPSLIDETNGREDWARMFATDLLPFSNPLNGSGGTSWPGDEFSRRDARDTFIRDYADKIRALAPKVPFSFIYAVDFDLPAYDEERHGFPLPSLEPASLQYLHLGVVHLVTDFEVPPLFWPVSETEARRLLAHLRQTQGSRRLRVAFRLDATQAEADTLTLKLALGEVAVTRTDFGETFYRTRPDASDLPHPDAANSLSRLEQLPKEFLRWRLRSLGGLPVLGNGVNANSSVFGLMAARYVPGYLEEHDAYQATQLGMNLLTETARNDYPGVVSYDHALERDEFERKAIKDSYLRRYLPIFKAVALTLPTRFVWLQPYRFGTYDFERHGFSLTENGMDVAAAARSAGLDAHFDFAKSDLFWPVPEREAERLRATVLKEHVVFIAFGLEAVGIDPARRMEFRQLFTRLYAPDLDAPLFEVAAANDRLSQLEKGSNVTLQVATPAQFNGAMKCAKILSLTGETIPDTVLDFCWNFIAARDAATYASGRPLDAFAENDAERPFFPRGGAARTRENVGAFISWMGRYARGLPPTAVATAKTYPSNDERAFFYAAGAQGLPVQYNGYSAWLQREHLQADQVYPTMLDDRIKMLVVLPNDIKQYGLELRRADFVKGAAQAVTRIKVGEASVVVDDKGNRVVAIAIEPLDTTVTSQGNVIASRSYADVPRLSGGVYVAPSSTAVPPRPEGPIALDGALVDLLALKAGGEGLSREALIHIVERRWEYENAGRVPVGARFFLLGKQKPSVMEALNLAPQLVSWAERNTPAYPFKAMSLGKLSYIKGNDEDLRAGLACFSGPAVADVRAAGAGYDVLECRRKEAAGYVPAEERKRCALAKNLSEASGLVSSRGASCVGDAHLRFSDPLKVLFRLPQDLPMPPVSLIGDRAEIGEEIVLELTGAVASSAQPMSSDQLPAAELDRLRTPARPQGEFVTIDSKLVTGTLRGPDGEVLATVGPESEARLEEGGDDAGSAAPSPGPDGLAAAPDLVGIRLGMSFSDAEAVIRAHMTVGQVLDGSRADDEAAKHGFPKPLTSGKLFVAQDGNELIAIIDEPPAAAGSVLLAWRRVRIPANTLTFAEIFPDIEKRYGSPNTRALSGVIVQWHGPSGKMCESMYQSGRAALLNESWDQDGRPTTYRSSPRQPTKAPAIAFPLFDPLAPQNERWKECGPFVTMNHLSARQVDDVTDNLDMTLTNIGPYLDAYARSRSALQAAQGSRRPNIKF